MASSLKSLAVGFALVGTATLAEAQKAQRTIEFSGTPKCANCGVRLQEIAMVGDLVVGSARLEPNAHAYDRTRKLAYVRGKSRTEIDAFGLDGKLQFTVGFHDRRPPVGARDNAFALGPEDSLWVLEPAQQRVTVYVPGTATVARNFRVKAHIDRILPLKDGQFVGVSSKVEDVPDHVRVHVFAADGKMMQALGAPLKASSGRPAVALSRKAGMVWIARPDSYALELWGTDGKQYSTVQRTVEWLSSGAIAKARRERRTPPAIVDVSEDDAGALWVSAVKPDPTFRPGSAKTAGPPRSDVLNVLEVLNVPAQRIDFADEIGLPLYRLGADYFVEPNVRDRVASWRVAKLSIVKR